MHEHYETSVDILFGSVFIFYMFALHQFSFLFIFINFLFGFMLYAIVAARQR